MYNKTKYSRAKHLSIQFSRLVICCILVVPASGCYLSRKLIFPIDNTKPLPAVQASRIIQVKNGDRTAYAYFTKRGPGLVIYLHGNGETINHNTYISRRLASQNISSLLIEYPGYGLASKYTACESDIYADSLFLAHYIQKKYSFKTDDTVIWGFSLGTGVATYLAEQQTAKALILVAPYTSIPDLAEYHYLPWLPHIFIWDRFNSRSRAHSLKIPTLIIHGRQDQIIPHKFGVAMHTLLPRSEMWSIPNAGHNSIYNSMYQTQWLKIYHFINNKKLDSVVM